MDRLPPEVLRLIINCLPPKDLASLQLVSRSLFSIARDNSVWRERCYRVQKERYGQIQKRLAHIAAGMQLGSWRDPLFEDTSTGTVMRWDPSDPEEEIDWYAEYIARYGPSGVVWFQSPAVEDLVGRDRPLDVNGVGILKDRSYGSGDQVIGFLENGSVSIWDASQRNGKFARSSRPLPLAPAPLPREKPKHRRHEGIIERISVDSISQRAYIADNNALNEVDLSTLQLISQSTFTESIYALSQEAPDYYAPITVATRNSLRVYDPRLQSTYQERDTFISLEPRSSSNLTPGYPVTVNYTELLDPGPNFVLHPPSPSTDSIVVAGRFPSILLYDRRNLGRLQASVHSGARLCGLAALSSIPKCYRSPDSSTSLQSIVACGEHKGMGSLELYSLLPSPDADGTSAPALRSLYKNRLINSHSKLLSVATHGSRVVFSDSEGKIKWMERDGKTVIRTVSLHAKPGGAGSNEQESINTPMEQGWGYDANCHVARKIIPASGSSLDQDGLVIWTGSQVGRLHFSHANEEDVAEEASEQDADMSRHEREAWRTFRQSMFMGWI
ncbi:F-box domain-containing protein [Nannizzia gypsea CBS 118893]|uniref:F-box domain-containing protein n=1 Tax=Arthroderma gypseum (strain ATCC MYA-4604 / CBS 118893) TaxID=535722 RepID=E5QZU3_ARTGP|nr:F-box domain-containing protein [Nannizzia gypsea CBS 118893]EFQ97406.1 F-box domain-containing protein [Nannizzia gypsea CBS 118893]